MLYIRLSDCVRVSFPGKILGNCIFKSRKIKFIYKNIQRSQMFGILSDFSRRAHYKKKTNNPHILSFKCLTKNNIQNATNNHLHRAEKQRIPHAGSLLCAGRPSRNAAFPLTHTHTHNFVTH